MIENVLFDLFAGIAVLGAVLMITRRNPVHAAFYLVTILLATGGIFLQLHARVLFAAQLILYAGGVMAMFFISFVVVRSKVTIRRARFSLKQVITILVGAALGAEFFFILLHAQKLTGGGLLVSGSAPADKMPSGAAFATSLFSDYLLTFELAGVLLTVAMVGVVVMARRRREEEAS